MKKISHIVVCIIIMGMVSVLCLLILSLFTYLLKWEADTALIGITVTYILTGFAGGICLKWYPKWRERKKEEVVQEQQMPLPIRQKMIEAVMMGTVFIGVLLLLSFVLHGNDFAVSERLLVIWLLLVGSACLGRIL